MPTPTPNDASAPYTPARMRWAAAPYLVGLSARPLVDGRARITDEEWVDFGRATPEEEFWAKFAHICPMPPA